MTRSRHLRRLSAPGLVGASLFAVFTQQPGWIVADARYEHLVDPTQFLQRHASLWDDARTLGEPSKYFSPVLGALQAAAAGLGASPWVLQRLTHALLLSAAAIGMLYLGRRILGNELGALVAALSYAFGAYAAQYLLPSGLFTAHAVAPWLAFAAYAGLRSSVDRWRWAAVFAIAVFAMGMLNTASLVLASLPVVVIVLAHPWLDRSSGFGAATAWVWRTAVLTIGVSAVILVALRYASPVFEVNLQITETHQTVAARSSASETWRGLGSWLSYFRFAGIVPRDQATPYFSNDVVIAATYVPMLLAAVGLVTARRRIASVWGLVVVVASVVMIGLFPVGDSAPFGSLLDSLFDRSVAARGFRTTYKAGPGQQIGLGLLAGWGTVWLTGAVSSRLSAWRRTLRSAAVVAVAAALGIAGFPFWTGNLYPTTERHESLPDHWTEAFAWFDQQSAQPAVFVLPSGARTQYTWGFVNDTLFDARLRQPVVSHRTLPQSTPALTLAADALDRHAGSPAYTRGSLAPALRQLGVRWVLIQNDIDWEKSRWPRPSAFDGLRGDPDFELAASFGDAGDYIARSLDREATTERELPPVEVYAIVDDSPRVGTVANGHYLVFGGGDALPALAAAEILTAPTIDATRLDADDVNTAVDRAAAVVFTDGNQRRAVQVFNARSELSHVLGPTEELSRPVLRLPDDPSQQTVATFPGLVSVRASSWGLQLEGMDAEYRPAAALDGDESTAWATFFDPSPTLELDLAETTTIQAIELDLFEESTDEPRLTGATVTTVTSAGRSSSQTVTFANGTARVEVGVDAVQRVLIELHIDLDAPRRLVGLSELRLETDTGISDTREFLRVPGPSAALASAISAQRPPVHHVFSRTQGDGRSDLVEDRSVRREFWAPRSNVEFRAHISIGPDTPDRAIDALVGATVGASATTRYLGAVDAVALAAIDGNLATAWQFDPRDAAELTIRAADTELDEIELWLLAVGGTSPFRLSRMTEFEVEIEGSRGVTTVRANLTAEPECDLRFEFGADDGTCIETVRVSFDRQAVGSIRIRPIEVTDGQGGLGVFPVQVADVRLHLGGQVAVAESATRATDGCRILLDLDGEPVSMRPVEAPTVAALEAGVEFVTCDDVQLSEGRHRLSTTSATIGAIDFIRLSPASEPDRGSSIPIITAVLKGADPTHIVAEVESGSLIVTTVPAAAGWTLEADGVTGRQVVANGFVAFLANEAGAVTLDLTYRPQQIYRIAWMISAAWLAVCLWLVVPTRRRS